MSEREKNQPGRKPFGGMPRRSHSSQERGQEHPPQRGQPARPQSPAPQRQQGAGQQRTPQGGQPARPQGGGQQRRPQGAEASRPRRGVQAPRERRFAARGSYRAQGGFALTIGMLMLFAAGALLGRWQDGHSPINILGAVICAGCGVLLLYAGWQVARPQELLLTQRGGALHRAGSPTRAWQWSEADRVEWLTPARTRFATPEPFLVLRGYAEGASDAQRFLIPLNPFTELAYAAIRERLLLNS